LIIEIKSEKTEKTMSDAALKSDVEYTRDKVASYIKAKTMILDYLKENGEITNATIQELCGFTKQQARSAIDKMRDEKLIEKVGKARGSKYVLKA
jgi:ATP-dependent DNA helicase RecG